MAGVILGILRFVLRSGRGKSRLSKKIVAETIEVMVGFVRRMQMMARAVLVMGRSHGDMDWFRGAC